MSTGGFYKKTDKAYIQQNQKDAQPTSGETVILRIVSGRTAGNPIEGVQPTLIYKSKKTKASIVRLTPDEVVASSGIYQHGDLKVQLLEKLNFTNEQSGSIGDRMIYEKQTYRIVGKTDNRDIEDRAMFFSYIMRKVGNQ